MNALTITLGTIGVLLSLVCWFAFISGALKMVNTVRIGQPAPDRWRPFFPRFKQMIVEFLAHTKMVKFRTVGWAHWLVMIGFMLGAIVWFEAYGQTFDPKFHWPIIGNTAVYHFIDEILGIGTVIGILVLIVIRQRNHPRRPGRMSRFSGSNFKAAYFVETVVLLEGLGMILVKAGKIATYGGGHLSTDFFTMQVAKILPASPELVSVFAFVKLMSGMVWLYIVGRNITWGVAWHRFSAFFNIYFKREDDGGPALGAARQMMSGGKPVDMEDADPDKDTFGAGRIEDFTWKGWLDFTTCTECGRCQSQCPAWNTGKPLSPKLLITSLRDHGYAKAPYLLAGGRTDIGGDEVGLVDAEGNPDEAKLGKIPASAREEAGRKLVGETEALVDAGELAPVIDTETLWSCTNCGACVEQCPVDIEHVDHIIDMRRYQVLIESDFPSELAGLFKNLENKGNPWGQNAKDRLNWINEMEFDIPVFGQDADSFDGYEYLFWVGCAGAYEDRAKKTTKAVAELLATAGVKFMVLGAEETCTGDSARRAGNEFLFQQLAQQNIEVLNGVFEGVEPGKRKIVVTCAHCFNALNNEYPQVGGSYEVVHHTQLLNRLVRSKKLVQVKAVGQDVTYHDPCFLGRHNKVYNAPRELMAASGAKLVEMPRHGERSMCCGAGGARMWMEEKIGKRINIDRVDEALTTNPAKIATGCPFCRVMLTDGVTARQEEGKGEGVEVIDVAQLMLESISRVEAAKLSDNIKVVQQPKTPVEVEETAEEVEKERVEEVEAAAATPAAPKTTGAPKAGGLQMKGGLKAPGGPKAPAAPKAKPGGLQMKGGLKGPGAKKAAAPAAPAPSEAPAAEAPAAPKAKPGGLQMKGGLKAPGAKAPGAAKPAPAPAASAAPAAETAEAAEAPAVPKAKPGGLQLKSGLKGPGPKKAAPAAAPAAPSEEAPAAEAPATEAPAAEAPAAAPKEAAIPKAKPGGLQLKSGLKGPGAKKSAAPAAPAEPEPEPEAPQAEAPQAEAPAKPEVEAPQAKPGALGFKPGAKAPGRK
ncbi:(Fe-S)-binding protein [Rhodococcus sp. CH91]|uniref:(Fe-S)-binding protein n=1 Tax=Rhodococcus sp. CH91 TaxID=2910256 RepID=UPI001F4B45B2|nr:(Fe-S)-binding protein [Rhodococcus sp. CH91]